MRFSYNDDDDVSIYFYNRDVLQDKNKHICDKFIAFIIFLLGSISNNETFECGCL